MVFFTVQTEEHKGKRKEEGWKKAWKEGRRAGRRAGFRFGFCHPEVVVPQTYLWDSNRRAVTEVFEKTANSLFLLKKPRQLKKAYSAWQ